MFRFITAIKELIHMVFTTEGLLEVAVENWPEWDLSAMCVYITYIIYTYIYIYIYMYI